MQQFRVDLKTFLGLAMPNQSSQLSESKHQAGFWGDDIGPNSPNLHDPYIHSTTVLYDMF